MIMKTLEIERNKAKILIPKIMKILLKNINTEISFIKCRIKSINSINNKIEKNKNSFKDIYDFIGFCIVVENKKDCYKVLEEIKKIKNINIRKICDYIKNPADKNKYQAIHVRCIYKGYSLEIQIRSIEMNLKAENDHEDYKLGKFELN